MSARTRKSFEEQCRRAELHLGFERSDLDVVFVRWPDGIWHISIVGSTIPRCTYEFWRRDGARFRILRTYKQGTK